MLAPCNCIFFVNSAVLVSVIPLSLYVSIIYCQLIFAFLLRSVRSFLGTLLVGASYWRTRAGMLFLHIEALSPRSVHCRDYEI